MKVKREDLNPCTVRLEITCGSDQVKSGFDRALKDLSKQIRVPGFRPGTAPRKMVEDAVNPQALFETAAEHVVRKAFDAAIQQENVKPDGPPAIEITKFERDSHECEFNAKIPLPPVVELSDYRGLNAVRPKVEVTDEEIEAQIDEIRRRQGKKQEVTDRGIQPGDAAVINLQASSDESDSRTFMVIAGQTFAGLDEAMTGMSTDEVKVVKLDFPASFQHEAWKGKKVEVRLSVKSVSAVKMPDLDDEFAKGMDFGNVDELKSRVKDAITDAKHNMVKDMLRDQLLDSLLGQSKVQVADTTWESVVVRRVQELTEELGRRNSNLEEYCKANGMTIDEFRASLEKEALVNVQRAVVIQKIFSDNGMKIESNDVDRHFRHILAENKIEPEKADAFAKEYAQQIREEIVFRAMASKVTDLLVEHAKIEEFDPGQAAQGAKPAAKSPKKPKSK